MAGFQASLPVRAGETTRMTNVEALMGPGFPPEAAPPEPKHVAAISAGNALEFYDFLTYAFFAPQIGRAFFPSEHPGASLLASLAAFGAGFLMRPVGALVLGRVADRIGRKPAMLISFTLMGLAMTTLALTPPFAVLGVAAPVIVILCRLVQGFALGGEVGPSTAYLIEAAPPDKRGLYTAFQYMGQDGATLVAGLVGFGLSSTLSTGQMDAWGWRLALGLGAVIVPFGLSLRRSLPETLHRPETIAAPLGEDPRAFRRIMILGFFLLASGTTASYVINYLNVYATETLKMPANMGFLATITTGAIGVVFNPFGGWLSDRVGRKPMMITAWAAMLLVAIPGFMLLGQIKSGLAVSGLALGLGLCATFGSVSAIIAITESLPKAIRSGSLGLLYAVAISIFGGSAQYMAAWLTGVLKSDLAPAYYLSGGVLVGLLAMVFMPETAPRRRRAAVGVRNGDQP